MAGCTFRVLATSEAAFAREGGVMFVRCRDLGTRCRRLHLLSSWSHSGRSAGCCGLLPAAHIRTSRGVLIARVRGARRLTGVEEIPWRAATPD
jgi:hypothetical protein